MLCHTPLNREALQCRQGCATFLFLVYLRLAVTIEAFICETGRRSQ